MAQKKTFIKDNPALQFISNQEEETKPEERKPATTPQAAANSGNMPPEGYKLNPLYIEKKTKRVQLVFQPSLYTKAKAEADKLEISFNEYIHRVLEDALREE